MEQSGRRSTREVLQALPGHVRADVTRRLRRRGRALALKDITVVDAGMLKRAVVAAALGNCMEWFDFGVYSYLAVVIGKVFFPDVGAGVQVLASFTTFAAAFLVRPLGGLYFGPLGDRIGRQRVLATTMLMMAGSTFAIGFIPGYDTIGIAAPILLLLCRMVQGFSTGGEYGGATTFIAEYSPDRRRGFLGSWLDFGTFTGYAAGSGVVTLLNATLGDQTVEDWAWRLPFLIAGPIGAIGLYIRLKLEDTPAYQEQLDAHDRDLAEQEAGTGRLGEIAVIFTRHWRAMLICIGLVLLYNVTNYMVTAYLPTYMTESLHRSTTSSDVLVLCAMGLVMALITFVGRASDRYGRRPVYLTAAAAQIVFAYPCFLLIRQDGWALPLLGILVLAALLAGFAGPTAATLPALFPTAIRYGAMGISFNIAVSAFGGTTPLVNAALVDGTHNLMMPAYYLIVSGLIGIVAALFLKESSLLPLRGSQPMVGTEEEAEQLVTTSELALAELRAEDSKP
ncbi:MHS family proline/betaine transporter-like MFS transporter [Nocardia transvalensis]|uniref:Putative proline/betaine transporter n=1 Tax=Nocardia transvalensis TaxID=37333 RepID=A0A7W9P7Z5_9NOCA|nr:glycine betaine/L-proline transporter ProP [Nocardia transvalensis]MBB5911169.1 MHS family proline/betaine transporter-like MFS transporter [Nocardia transvalensis]